MGSESGSQTQTTMQGLHPRVERELFGGPAIRGFEPGERVSRSLRGTLGVSKRNDFAIAPTAATKGIVPQAHEIFDSGGFETKFGRPQLNEAIMLANVAKSRDAFTPFGAGMLAREMLRGAPRIDEQGFNVDSGQFIAPQMEGAQINLDPFQAPISVDLSGRFDPLLKDIEQRSRIAGKLSGNDFGSNSLAQQAFESNAMDAARQLAIDENQINAGLEAQNRGLLADLTARNAALDFDAQAQNAGFTAANQGLQAGLLAGNADRGAQLATRNAANRLAFNQLQQGAAGLLGQLDTQRLNNQLARVDSASQLARLNEAFQNPEARALERFAGLVSPLLGGQSVQTTSAPTTRNRTAGALGGAAAGFQMGGPWGALGGALIGGFA